MAELRTVRIADLGRVVTGKTPPSTQPGMFGGDCPFLTPTDIDGVARYIEPERFLSPEGRDYQQRLMLPARAVCTVCIGATIGKVCMTDRPSFTNQQINSVIVNEIEHDPFFVYHLLTTLRDELKANAGGAATPIINKTAFSEIEVSVPPLLVQRRIAGILSAYDELIENNQRRIKILEEMARSLYREWFVHFRFPGHDKVKMVPSALGPIPQGWEVKPLGELATVTMGLSPKGDTYNEDEDGTLLVNGPVEFGDRFTKRVKWTTEPTKFCKEGDLVVCVRGSTTGKYVKSDGVYCLGRGVCGINSSYQCFIELLFENELPILLGQTSGSTFPSWTGPQLKFHPVLSPTHEVLARFDALVKPMSTAVLGHSRQIQNLRRTRDLLLPRLLSGQVNIKIQ